DPRWVVGVEMPNATEVRPVGSGVQDRENGDPPTTTDRIWEAKSAGKALGQPGLEMPGTTAMTCFFQGGRQGWQVARATHGRGAPQGTAGPGCPGRTGGHEPDGITKARLRPSCGWRYGLCCLV